MKKTKVVIVGGGFGGVKTALMLANNPAFDITLISLTGNFEYHGALYRSATGHSPLEVVIPLRDIFKRARNVQIVLDKIVHVNAVRRCVTSELGNIYDYDYVVFAMGNVVNYFGIKGMDKHSMSMATISDTIALRQKLIELARGRKEELYIAIIGAGPSGVELAGELGSFMKKVAHSHGKAHKKLKLMLIEGADRVLPMMNEKASKKAKHRLKKLGVQIHLNTIVNACEPGKVCMKSGDLDADLIIWTAGSKPVDFYSQFPSIFPLKKGRVAVDEHMLVKGQKHIYVIGDNAATPFSGMAQTALHDAKFVAHDLKLLHSGKRRFVYRVFHPIYVIPIGPNWAVSQTGKGVISGYKGWLVRRRADLWVFKNFEPYKKAIKTWRRGNRLSHI